MSVVPFTRLSAPVAPLLRQHAARPDLLDGIDLTGNERSWQRIASEVDAELWLIVWPAGTSTGWHDHGSASGAFMPLRGALTEYSWDGAVHRRTLRAGEARSFDGSHIHDVVNRGAETAISLHAYTPRLASMTRYELVRGRLAVTSVERRDASW